MSGFIQNSVAGTTTLSEITRVRNIISADGFFGCFAYATQSGFRAFELAVGKGFWKTTNSRWLFGVDYGRTDPSALRAFAEQENTEVRVFDGSYVVGQRGFIPRRDFHPKISMMDKRDSNKHGLVVGSGNLSYNGLCRSVEAGSSIVTKNKAEFDAQIKSVRAGFEDLWKSACPLKDIAKDYQNQMVEFVAARDLNRSVNKKCKSIGFWIEAGYVTKNRGFEKPGNQIFAPNGFRSFFNLKKTNKKGTTRIGEIAFETEVGPVVTKNYRDNDNGMEKLTLPMPEDHGFGVFDGKVLVFFQMRVDSF